ncbi:MAG: PHP domain-containing protein, partial [Planctomycetota bacterium]|nr:PHP domain-containing protein [Planctomycetota bacterium]
MTDSPLLLGIRSWGSFLRGYQAVEDLVETSQRCGWNSVAITEVADLGTAVEATREGLKQGTQIVTGVELPFSKNDSILILPRDP